MIGDMRAVDPVPRLRPEPTEHGAGRGLDDVQLVVQRQRRRRVGHLAA
jgi:hypothetical protein